MRALIAVFVVVGIVLLALYLYRSSQKDGETSKGKSREEEESLRIGDLELVPSGESEARAERALPTRGSEDKRDLLRLPVVEAPPQVAEEQKDYGPNEQTEWVVDIEFSDDRIVTTEEVDRAFAGDWYKPFGGATFFGYSPEEGRWTYLHAADVPTRWTAVAVATDLVRTYTEKPQIASEDSLAAFLHKVEQRALPLKPDAVAAREPVEKAAARARSYFQIWETASLDAIIVLASPAGEPFAGEDVWDVMYSLGLPWGDMDLFHWENPGLEGGDYFFDVWTTTAPGYFIPELIAGGEVRVDDLVFGFSVPRSVAPSHVYRQMLVAANYAQERLGGRLLAPDGVSLDEAKALGEIEAVVSILLGAGMAPGSEVALRLF